MWDMPVVDQHKSRRSFLEENTVVEKQTDDLEVTAIMSRPRIKGFGFRLQGYVRHII